MNPARYPYGTQTSLASPALTIWVPAQKSAGNEPRRRRSPASRPHAPSPDPAAARLRILVIEDNQDYADSLRILFELYGHEATVAYSGIDGVEAALAQPPDLVVCDIGLPGLDGFEVAQTLRANPLTARICLVAVTGYGTENDRKKTAESGFDAHLVKPVDALDILGACRSSQGPAGTS